MVGGTGGDAVVTLKTVMWEPLSLPLLLASQSGSSEKKTCSKIGHFPRNDCMNQRGEYSSHSYIIRSAKRSLLRLEEPNECCRT